jgi:hypothetical protein
MIDPPQLKIASPHGLSRVLLQSARDDHSAPGAAQRALHALGSGLAIGGGAVAAKASLSPALSANWPGLLVMKWLFVGVLAGVSTLGLLEYVASAPTAPTAPSASPRTANPPSVRVNPGPGAPAVPATPALASAAPEVVVPSLPVANALPLHAPPSSSSEPELKPPTASAADELRALRAVRSALGAHAPQRALALLDAFDSAHRGAALAEEAAMLRVEALADLGSDDARALAEDFLRRYPHSAYALRLKSQLHLP